MKKASRKLVLRSETLRTLANMELAHAVGGVVETGAKQCPVAAADSGDFRCPGAVAATAGCG